MTARLILNLKSASSQPSAPKHHYGFDGAQSLWEANIIGNIGNEFEGDTTYASTVDSYANFKGKGRQSEADDMGSHYRQPSLPAYELHERHSHSEW